MKKYLLFIIMISFVNIILSPNLFSENKKELEYEMQQAKNTFNRLMENAHPTPDAKYFQNQMLVPLQDNTSFLPFFLNINIIGDESNQSYKMQNESSIAINPKNPKNLIASAVDYRDNSSTWVYVSSDGGNTWTNIDLGKPFSGWQSTNDPSVFFDNDGTGYLVYGGFGKIDPNQTQMVGENGVFLAKTTDEGKTWTAHIPIILHQGNQTLDSNFEDKYYIQVDNSVTSPYRHSLYVPWKRVTPRDSATQIVIAKSLDRGQTWSEPIPISPRKTGSSEDTTYGQSFPLATTGPNGEIYVVWNDGIVHGVGFAKSIDGGKTYSSPKIIQKYNIFGITKYIESQGGYRHTVKGKVRAEAYPVIQCDITGGPRNGYLYLTWAADSIPNIYFSRSTDFGETWSNPVIVHSVTTNDQFWQWMAIDPKNGDIAVMYFDSRDDINNILVNCYVSYSNDGGLTWIDKRVGDGVNDLRLNPFMDNAFAGDYSGVAFFNGKIFPSWVDMRNAISDIRDDDVYTAIIDTRSPLPVENLQTKIFPDLTDRVVLSWINPTTFSFGQKLQNQDYQIKIVRDNKLIATLNGGTTNYLDTGLEEYKNYQYDVYTIAGIDSSIIRSIIANPGGSLNPAQPILVSAVGFEDQTDYGYDIMAQMPTLRGDSTTPLVDLDSVAFYLDGSLVSKMQVLSSDTGKIIAFHLSLSKYNLEKGFYLIQTAAQTSKEKLSILSNSLLAYSGSPIEISESHNFEENFDGTKLPKYFFGHKWGKTQEIALSLPYSLTDSPNANYENNTKDTFLLFPVNLTEKSQINFYQAVIVEPNDLATVEFSSDNGLTWSNQFENKTAIYSKNDYSFWNDGILDERDWLEEHLVLPVIANNVLLRFRISTNVFKNDIGWFIDNISITPKTTSVQNHLFSSKFAVYPNPVKEYLKIDNSSNMPNLTYSIYAMEGVNVLSGKINEDAIINLKQLSSGFYSIIIYSDNNIVYRDKIIKL